MPRDEKATERFLDDVLSHEERIRIPACVRTAAGVTVAREVARERWAVYMKHSNDPVLERLVADLVVVGAHMKLEPWRFSARPGPKGRAAVVSQVDAYERRQERLRELAERVRRIS